MLSCIKCNQLGFSYTYSSTSSLSELHSCDAFIEDISPLSMRSLQRWLARISLIAVQFDVVFENFIFFRAEPAIAILFRTYLCHVNYIIILKYLKPGGFSQRDALSCLFLSVNSFCAHFIFYLIVYIYV